MTMKGEAHAYEVAFKMARMEETPKLIWWEPRITIHIVVKAKIGISGLSSE